ncbi:MAG: hypothetical protein D6732_28850 [Methanobacteriota archaeon]|nr:MAG: hypothetical protein D6732_28850 [Euryarchaeota archaeon]
MKKLSIGLLLTAILLFSNVPLRTNALTQQDRVMIFVTDAYYGDADGDGYTDDVIAIVDIAIESNQFIYLIQYEIYLQMPSGTVYGYIFWIFTMNPTIHIVNNFYNHATEKGDYTIHAFADFAGTLYPSGYDTHTFDPPGGDNGDPPTIEVIVS